MRFLAGVLVLPLAPIVYVLANLFDPKYSFKEVIKGWEDIFIGGSK